MEGVGGRWLLAHCDDGVVWGRRVSERDPWSLSSAAFPSVSPSLGRGNVQQLRVFGPEDEALVWREEDGLRGRHLVDLQSDETPAWQRPHEERRLVLGTDVHSTRGGFSLVSDTSGARHAPPWELAPGKLQGARLWLRLKHYFEFDPTTGVVRVAATRLIALEGP